MPKQPAITPVTVEFKKPVVELILKPQIVGELAQNAKTLDEALAAIARITTTQNGNKPQRLFNSTIGGVINPLFDDGEITPNNYGGHFSVLSTMNFGFMFYDIARSTVAQISRHNHNSPIQEFSTRYSSPIKDSIFALSSYCQIMKAGKTSRQGTNNALPMLKWQENKWKKHLANCGNLYQELIASGASLETARELLPLGTCTKLYINFNLRTIITMLMQRLHHSAQAAVRDIANQIKDILIAELPLLCAELNNFKFWGVIKGDDLISQARYAQMDSLAYGVEPNELTAFRILANNLDCRLCSAAEKEELKAVFQKYRERLTKLRLDYLKRKIQ